METPSLERRASLAGKVSYKKSLPNLPHFLFHLNWCVYIMCFPGELQSILCAAFSPAGVAYSGTLSGDVYKWKGHTLQSVIKAAHKVQAYANTSANASANTTR